MLISLDRQLVQCETALQPKKIVSAGSSTNILPLHFKGSSDEEDAHDLDGIDLDGLERRLKHFLNVVQNAKTRQRTAQIKQGRLTRITDHDEEPGAIGSLGV